MVPRTNLKWHRSNSATRTALLAFTIIAMLARTAPALITGGEGNGPIADPGWPKGTYAIFNNPGRIAWWEGPPFGGGQWYAECRGDAKALSAVLADMARLDVPTKRVVLHDGVGQSFWLNPNREPQKQEAATIAWTFIVWQPPNWERLRQLPVDVNPTDPRDADKGPPTQVDVYTGTLRWSDVIALKGSKSSISDWRRTDLRLTMAACSRATSPTWPRRNPSLRRCA